MRTEWIEAACTLEDIALNYRAAYQLLGVPVRIRYLLGGVSVQVPQGTSDDLRRNATLLAWPKPTQRWAERVDTLILGA